MFCTKCGNEIRKDMQFCPVCGASIKKGASKTTSDSGIVNALEKQGERKKMSSFRKRLLIAGSTTLIIVVLITLAVFELDRKNKMVEVASREQRIEETKTQEEAKNQTKKNNDRKKNEKNNTKMNNKNAAKDEEKTNAARNEYNTTDVLCVLNCPVYELAEMYGDDFVIEEGLYLGGQQRIYYEDKRVWAMFGYDSQTPDVYPDGDEIINAIYVYAGDIDGTVVESLNANMTMQELKQTGYFEKEYYDNILGCTVGILSEGEFYAEFCFDNPRGKSDYVIFSVVWDEEESEESLVGKEDTFDITGIWAVEGRKIPIDPLAQPIFDENPKIQIEVLSVSDDENEITILYTGAEPYQNVFYPGETYKGQLMGIERCDSSIDKMYSVYGVGMEFSRFFYYGDSSDIRECCHLNEGTVDDTILWKR